MNRKLYPLATRHTQKNRLVGGPTYLMIHGLATGNRTAEILYCKIWCWHWVNKDSMQKKILSQVNQALRKKTNHSCRSLSLSAFPKGQPQAEVQHLFALEHPDTGGLTDAIRQPLLQKMTKYFGC